MAEAQHLPAEHTVVHGDTLSELAKHYYGDGTEHSWRQIYEANQAVIGPNPDVIVPGQKLTIPVRKPETKPPG